MFLGEFNGSGVPVPSSGNGALNLTGAGSTLTCDFGLFAGMQGAAAGDIDVTAGATLNCLGSIYLGYAPGTSATLELSTPASWVYCNTNTYIGYQGSATVSITGGADWNITDQVSIGALLNSVGHVVVDGPGSSFTCQGLFVGAGGAGHLTLSGGATGDALGPVLGDTWIAGGTNPGSAGTMLVTGEGTTWHAGHTLSVGRGGTGALTINDGADVTTESLRIGAFGLGTPLGTLTIDGPGSTLASTVDFTIGGTNTGGPEGVGTLIISNGAVITHQALNLPHILLHAGSEIILDNGTLTAPALVSHGTFRGAGTLNADLASEGAVTPGNPGGAGTLTVVGDGELQSPGALNMEIGGVAAGKQHDVLDVAGSVTLGGTLNLALIDGFTPAPGQQFAIIHAGGGVSGSFAAVNPAEDWSVIVEANDVLVRRINDCPADIVTGGASAGVVNIDDLLAVISAWGACPAPPAACPADIAPGPPGGGDGVVNIDDLLAVISAWGACP
jgi:T5SS/PEP-CTERM-associated repeat protein